MSILALIHLIAFIGDIALIIIVIDRNYKARLNRLCVLVTISFAIWSFGYCLTHVATTPTSALFWINISSIGWVTFPIAGLYFYLALAGKERIIRSKFFLLASIIFAVFFVYQQWSGNIVGTVIKKAYGWSGVWSTSIYSYLLFLYFFSVVVIFFYLIYDYGRKVKTNRERVQAKLLLVTAVIGCSLGLTTDIILPILHITIFPQVADIFVSIWGVGIVICITRYGLMSVSPITAAGQILDTMTDALILLEPDGSIRLSNRATLELLECNEKELNGTQFGALTADKESADNFLEKTMRTGKSINEELIFSTKTGKNIPVLISASVIQDRTKTIVGFVVLARDITERKQLEESIRYHASLVETVSDAIVSSDKDYKIITWNKGAEEIYGWRKEEVIGKNILDILKPVYLNAVIEDMRGSMDRIGYWEGESIQQKKDGTKLNSLDSVSMIKDAQGNNIGAVSVFKDITERKHMEEALKESEERFFKAFRASPDAISIARLSDGIFLEVNDSYLEATGYTREELIGRSADLLNMWANPEQKDRMTQSIRNLVRMRNVEFQFRTKSGEIRTKLISNEFIHLSGVPCFLVVSIDITERKKAETALQQQKELTDRILATTPNAVLVIGADSKIELANLAYCNIFEKSVDGVVGKSISEIMPVPELLQAISKAASLQESHVKCEFKYKVNNRGIVFVANILQMQRGEVQLILNDVTEERERQDRLYLTDRLASVGEMASGIAHELNNPLTSVIGLSGLLVKMDMPEDVKEDMIAIRNEAQRAATIVRNLLTFARRHSQTREFVKVSNIVEDVIRLRSYEQKVNNITITADFSADLPEVLVDYFQIQQVFLNIILNAESAMIDAHGKGTLSIVGREAGKNVVVSFADDGPGIPSEIMGRIFDPFFTTKEVGKGTGLGLSICYGIVTAHGGKIYARSEYGQGATFVVELPVNGGHQVE